MAFVFDLVWRSFLTPCPYFGPKKLGWFGTTLSYESWIYFGNEWILLAVQTPGARPSHMDSSKVGRPQKGCSDAGGFCRGCVPPMLILKFVSLWTPYPGCHWYISRFQYIS